MNELSDRLLEGGQELADVLPALSGALVILLTGYLVARQLQRCPGRPLPRPRLNPVAGAPRPGEAAAGRHLCSPEAFMPLGGRGLEQVVTCGKCGKGRGGRTRWA